MEKQEKIIKCIDVNLNKENCAGEFVFSVNEQEFYEGKKLAAPKRCNYCRGVKKARFNNK